MQILHHQKLLFLASVASHAAAHFVLQLPASLGFDDTLETMSPCDSFDPTNRDTVTFWPTGGYPVLVLTTHEDVTWDYNFALVSDLIFKPFTPTLHQTGVGTFCEPQLPGLAEWIGQDVVFQAIQHAPDGELYQCAAVTFIDGPAFPIDGLGCSNTTGITATWLGSSPTSSTTSLSPPPPSSTSSSTPPPSSTISSSVPPPTTSTESLTLPPPTSSTISSSMPPPTTSTESLTLPPPTSSTESLTMPPPTSSTTSSPISPPTSPPTTSSTTSTNLPTTSPSTLKSSSVIECTVSSTVTLLQSSVVTVTATITENGTTTTFTEHGTTATFTQHGTTATVTEHGTTATVTEHGTTATVTEHGTTATITEYGTTATITEYGTTATITEYGTTATITEYGTAATITEHESIVTTVTTGCASSSGAAPELNTKSSASKETSGPSSTAAPTQVLTAGADFHDVPVLALVAGILGAVAVL